MATLVSIQTVLGKREEAARGAERLRRFADDPEALRATALSLLDRGDKERAAALLEAAPADHPELVLLRAQARAEMNDDVAAKRDLEAVLPHIQARRDLKPRFQAAEVALAVDEIALAEQLLADLQPDVRSTPGYLLLSGRIAFARNQIDEGTALYRQAARFARQPLWTSAADSGLGSTAPIIVRWSATRSRGPTLRARSATWHCALTIHKMQPCRRSTKPQVVARGC